MQFMTIVSVEVIDDMAVITWKNGLDGTTITGIKSAFFINNNVANTPIMEVDKNDDIFSTNNDMIISNLVIEKAPGGGNENVELGYGPTKDSTAGWTLLLSLTAMTQDVTVPRDIFLPKGNYLTLNRSSGSVGVRFGEITITQNVANDSDLNDDMEGNSP